MQARDLRLPLTPLVAAWLVLLAMALLVGCPDTTLDLPTGDDSGAIIPPDGSDDTTDDTGDSTNSDGDAPPPTVEPRVLSRKTSTVRT